MEELMKSIKNTPEYIQAVKSKGEETVNNAIGEAVESDRFKRYKSLQTRKSIILAALNSIGRIVETDGDAVTESLLLLGGGDSFGTKRPINLIAMRNDGSFVTIPMWGTPKFDLPCKAQVTGTFDSKWNSINVQDGGITGIEPVSLDKVTLALSKVALDCKNPVHQSKLENLTRYDYYAVKGQIQWINGSPIFNEQTRIGENPLVTTDQRTPPENHVTCAISLDGSDTGYSIALQFPRQRHGRPGIFIDDFENLCFDAVDAHPGNDTDTIKSQCKFVREGVYGRTVIGVGQASSIKDVERKDGNHTLYINLTCGFVAEVSQQIEEAPAKEKLFSEEETEAPVVEQYKEFKSAKERLNAGKVETVEEGYINAIIEHARDIGTTPQVLTPKEVREIAEIPDSVSNDLVCEYQKIAVRKFIAVA